MIRLFRLTTGEDLIGTPDADTTTDDFQGIKQPFVLIPMQGRSQVSYEDRFHYYIPYTKDKTIKIKKANIITETTPDDNMINAYQQNTGQIVTPKAKIIT